MNPEEKADNLVRKNFQKLNIPKTIKERPFHKTRKGDGFIYEVGERGMLVRYFVRIEGKDLLLRRIITKFYEDRYKI